MKVQDIAERLVLLGLEPGEAQVYVHLSIAGPQKAGDVAGALRLQRTETYRTLEALVQRGFAEATADRPSRFVAAPVEQVFHALQAHEEAQARVLRAAEASIAPALRSLRPATAADRASKNTFKLLQGRREPQRVLERMLRSAGREVFWVDTHPHAVALAQAAGLWDLAQRRAAEGLRVQALLTPPPAGLASPPPAFVRTLAPGRTLRVAVVDDREVLAWLASDATGGLTAEGDAAVWSDAADFVATQRTLFLHLWRQAAATAARPAVPGASYGDAF